MSAVHAFHTFSVHLLGGQKENAYLCARYYELVA